MAIFKKLSVGDTVATSGTRAFKKLTTEEPGLPIWNGTDLKGTTWTIRSGWTAEAGYGNFDVTGSRLVTMGTGIASIGYNSLDIGYEAEIDGSRTAKSNKIAFGGATYSDTSVEIKIGIHGGTDATNPRLINWLLENGRLTSHQFNIKGTWLFNKTITDLPIVYAEGEELPTQSHIDIFFSTALTGCYSLYRQDDTLLGSSMLPVPIYDYGTNSWSSDSYRYLSFQKSVAKNYIGEDVSQILYKWLTVNASKQGQITFTIDGKTYRADDGMTWMQWIGSDNNPDDYYYFDVMTDRVCTRDFAYYVATDVSDGTNNYIVDRASKIIAGYNYVLVQV